MNDDSPGLRIVDEGAGPSDLTAGNTDTALASSSENGHPARKNGFICSQSSFADELEALRKISYASTASSTRSAEEILRKHSMDPDEYLRKASCISDCYYDLPIDTRPKMSDAIPHINIGREYQARVRKWNDRKIHASELEAIEDRDEIVFSPEILRDIEKDQIEAFELLACSQAVPRPGRNKELALHLLMENKGNIEAAVADLLRSDTLDWEQYQIIYGSSYLDSTVWTPEEVNAFQDAIYKTEKDFHQVAQEVCNFTNLLIL
ncbi:ELM2 domain protein [Oesophagostomum dentatum]|uniref:ELM2 domain protein n=1 Tax=Oesophagostomum dentatum TaxID=61180 RepID=A0A0B1TU11_OESDE|nr:ELM2 domain protein [Oesophagostomum dentatum]